MFAKWLPWKYVVRRVARAQGFVDPISVLSRLHSFAEPGEVAAPLELLRAGVVFQARGLMNAGTIQHNRDWVWPFWVERQFDPHDDAFLPRAFSITHVNLTHRNWTAVGIPGCDQLPIVDPRGLLTPYWDGWSIDGWIFQNEGGRLIPARERVVQQTLSMEDGVAVTTHANHAAMDLQSTAEVVRTAQRQNLVSQHWRAESERPSWLLLSVRPYNPEGVSFIHDIELNADSRGWNIGEHGRVRFSEAANQHFTSDYRHGDVSALVWNEGAKSVHCPVGMATAAAAFRLEPGVPREVTLSVPLDEGRKQQHWLGHRPETVASVPDEEANHQNAAEAWKHEFAETATLDVPDERFKFLHATAMRSLVLHTPDQVFAGPFTYKRFWVRDSVFAIDTALRMGLHRRADRGLDYLLRQQDRRGFFSSQQGEWDSNGQVLWLIERYLQMRNRRLPEVWQSIVRKAADWICRKRQSNKTKSSAQGLMPAGFSAEHLGSNDFYYWDNFWSVAGLQAAARLLKGQNRDPRRSQQYQQAAAELHQAIELSLQQTDYLRDSVAYPAAPERRMDAGAIGSIAASHPLQLVSPDDDRLRGTVEFLMSRCLVDGAFFQDMIHSGINPNLTLQLAQTLLRGGDARGFELVNAVAKLASPTGQWPEAIHPRTGGGCMGDGQHLWTAAEWLATIRNLFVREERNSLVIGSGIPAHWYYQGENLKYGPTWTPWGRLSLELQFRPEMAEVHWHANWHHAPPAAKISIPCFHELDFDISEPEGSVTVNSNHTCNYGVGS